MNLLNKYLKFTEQHEAKEIFHKWCFISIIGSILSGRCWTNLGYSKLNPNFFVVLAGPPALPRKTEAIKAIINIAQPLIDEGFLQLSSESSSAANLIDELGASELSCEIPSELEKHNYMTLLTIATEITNFLPENDRILHSLLLKLYDGENKCDHGTRYKGKVELKNVSLNLLAATTHDFFNGTKYKNYVDSGFTSRCILLYLESKKGNISDAEIDMKLKKEIQEDLFKLTKITGPIKFSEAGKKRYNDWYSLFPTKLEDFEGSMEFLAYYGRKQTHVRKLALILWAIDYIRGNFAREIAPSHVTRAIELVDEAEKYITAGYKKGGNNPEYEAFNKISSFFQSKRGIWISRQEVIEQFINDVKREVIDVVIDILSNEMGMLKIDSRGGKSIYKFVGVEK